MLLQQIINGLTIGSTFALVAIGFTMVFGVLQLVNFANGALFMLGAYLTLIFYTAVTGNILTAILISLVLSGLAGYLLDRSALRLLRKQNAPRLSGLITTLGMAMIIENSIMVFYGSETRPFPNYLNFGRFELGSAIVTWTQVILFAITIVLMVMMSLIVYKTRIGKAMLSTSQNVDAARLMGVNINNVISFTFIVSGLMAAVAGTMMGMYYQVVGATMGVQIGMKVFAAAILGGVGSLPGAMVGGLTLGIIETLAAGYISSGYRDAIVFSILIIVLLFRPTGMLGQKHIEKV